MRFSPTPIATPASGVFGGAELVQIIRLVEAAEDPERVSRVSGSPDNDAVGPSASIATSPSAPSTRAPQRLGGKVHLALGGGPRHSFTVTWVLTPLRFS